MVIKVTTARNTFGQISLDAFVGKNISDKKRLGSRGIFEQWSNAYFLKALTRLYVLLFYAHTWHNSLSPKLAHSGEARGNWN